MSQTPCKKPSALRYILIGALAMTGMSTCILQIERVTLDACDQLIVAEFPQASFTSDWRHTWEGGDRSSDRDIALDGTGTTTHIVRCVQDDYDYTLSIKVRSVAK